MSKKSCNLGPDFKSQMNDIKKVPVGHFVNSCSSFKYYQNHITNQIIVTLRFR